MRISDWSSDVCSSDLTLAFTEPNGKWDASGIEATASKDGDAYKISGTKMFVLDGAQANLLIVAAKTDAGVSLFAVDPAGSGVTRTNLATMDQTRKQAKVELDGASGTLIGTDGAGWTTLERGLDRSEEHTNELQSLMRISY